MNKTIQWAIVFAILIGNNVLLYAFAVHVLFGSAASLPILLDYITVIIIAIGSNATVIQLLVSIRLRQKKKFLDGAMGAVIQLLGSFLFAMSLSIIGLVLACIGFFIVIRLLIKQIKEMMNKPGNHSQPMQHTM